jgi:hypothetical protein
MGGSCPKTAPGAVSCGTRVGIGFIEGEGLGLKSDPKAPVLHRENDRGTLCFMSCFVLEHTAFYKAAR